MTSIPWGEDRLLPSYESYSWVLDGAAHADSEPAIDLTATLVRRNPPHSSRAVIYLHGWSDYFFQTHLADFWYEQGYDFYAVELRRYGRNLRPGLLAGYITDLDDYFTEMDEAYRLVASEGHDKITILGHSTGGLITSLWADHTDYPLNGLILNSPWLDMHEPDVFYRALRPLISSVASIKPTSAIHIPDNGLYWQSISNDFHGEWQIDQRYKSHPGFQIRFGWGKAILTGQTHIENGLSIQTPILAMMSTSKNLSPKTWDPSLREADLVLDVDRLAAAAHHLGRQVTIVRIDKGMHDLILSPPPVRQYVFDTMAHWARCYL